jgi:large subunit ribosomal protein L28
MARRCALSGKGVMVGNNVSHANNKTKRRFLPNLHRHSMYSETLGESVRVRVSVHGLRTVEHRGGLDNFLLDSRDAELPGDLRRLKRRIRAARAAAESERAETS